MRIWGVLCLVSCLSDLKADIIDVSDSLDEKPGVGVISHVEEDAPQEDADESKPDLSSFLKENTDTLLQSQEELEKEPFLIVPTDQTSPPGGGVRYIDPKIAKLLPPPKDTPWWERWWDAVTTWFSGESS